jgi:hypothetical protein
MPNAFKEELYVLNAKNIASSVMRAGDISLSFLAGTSLLDDPGRFLC